jgi:signal transduction histidine kinase/CheY-like chemotaxis protein
LPGLPASRVREVDHALGALERASGVLQKTMAERDRSLVFEREARAAAEAASRNKDAFLAMLGHELRNPIAAVSYAAQVMKNERRTQEQVDFAADVISRQTHHLKRLIDDLLDVSRVMRGKIVLERAPLDLAATVRRVAATLQGAGRLAERRLDVRASPAWVHGDATRIEQIVGNLLVNAATYTARGGCIRVHVGLENGTAVLEVADDGQGIAPEHLPRVFELFYQADPSIERTSGGLGIGLTLVQQLAQLHGGSVDAASPGKGQGATFTVRIPATSAPGQSLRTAAEPLAGVRRTVLLVEDNPDARESLRMALELDGHKVLEAGNALAGLSLLDQRPDVAVVDIGLPGVNGYEFARRARARAGPGVRLIALTGFAGSAEEKLAHDAGFDCHLTKPVVLSELAAAISSPFRSEPASRLA